MKKTVLSMMIGLSVLTTTSVLAKTETFEIEAYRQWINDNKVDFKKEVFLKTTATSNEEEEIDITFKKGMNVYYPQKYNEEQVHEIVNVNLRYDTQDRYVVSSLHEQVFDDGTYLKMSSANTAYQKFDSDNMIIFSYQNKVREIGTDKEGRAYQETWVVKKID